MEARSRTRLLRALVFAALAGLLVLAWTQRDRFMPIDVGARVPDYSATTLNGESFSLAAERGKVVVLNVWATWCLPCRREMPALERLHETLATRGLDVIGVSSDPETGSTGGFGEKSSDVRAFVKAYGITFRIIHDPAHTVEQLFLVQGLPTTLVVNKQGRIVAKVMGAREWASKEYLDYFEKLLSE
ncbi:MAG TPA: TlpA disulfide reductase family protein [Longimicrobiales bacterium]